VEHVARLAHLTLSESETSALAKDLSSILGHVEELASVPTEGVPPTSHIRMGDTALRPDDVEPGLTEAEALGSAPRKSHGGFAVPTFVE
jgi:aspartyl-tRNA(Asn)/glutamyl-tRNA(Gln) amidotransferase subunit C